MTVSTKYEARLSPGRSPLLAITALLIGLVCPSDARAQGVLHVDRNATGANDGTSWDDAFVHLQDALDSAKPGEEVWVAKGVYRPDEGLSVSARNRFATFLLRPDIRLFGGFSGVEVRRTARRVDEFKTVLSGDLAGDDGPEFVRREENALHVVTAVSIDSTALLDGFYITGGYALVDPNDGFSEPTDSVGAGILLIDASPVLFNLSIIGNRAYAGGGLHSVGGAPKLANVVATGNRARRGGAIFLERSNARITNSTIVNNAAEIGAGIYNRSSAPMIANSILNNNGPAGDPDSNFECERLAYPCTYAAVALPTRMRSRALADSAYAFLTATEMIDWLRSKPEVEAVGGSEDVVRFRITDGTPTWILLESAVPFNLSKFVPLNGPTPSFEVAGRDRNSDGKVSNRDGRHALIVDPFNSTWGTSSDGQMLDQKLARTAGYERLSNGQVNWVKDAQVTPEVFAGWNDYELVHVSTHGDGYCENNDPPFCYTYLSTGIQLSDLGAYPPDVFAPQTITVPRRVVDGIQHDEEYFLGLGEDWFRKTYTGKGSLDKTLIFLNACKTHNPATVSGSPAGMPFFLTSLIPNASSSSVLVWTEVVPVVGAHVLATEIYEELLRNGRTIGNVMIDLRRDGKDVIANSTGTTQLKLVGNDKLRLREVVFLLSGSQGGALLEDGEFVNPFLDGVVGDGDNDHLELSVLLDGAEDQADLNNFRLQFYLDQQPIGSQFTPQQADKIVPIDGFPKSYVLEKRVPAGRDFKLNQSYHLEVVATLPDETAESRYEATISSARCFWNLTIGGIRGGFYAGERAQFVDLGGRFTLTLDSVEPTPITEVFLPSLPSGPSGPYTLGANDVGDGAAVVSFQGLYASPPFQYLTGDGGVETDVDNNVVFTRPGPSNMTIAGYDSVSVEGDASGQMFAWTNLDPLYPEFESASWALQFKAESALNPDGTLNLGACGG